VHLALELRCAAAVSVCQEIQEHTLRKLSLSQAEIGFADIQENLVLTQTIFVSVGVLTTHGSVGLDETVKARLLGMFVLKVVAEVFLSVLLDHLHIAVY